MKSRWKDKDADEFLAKYADQWGEDLALRTYTARLLGAEKSLVLHGGGNTSVKSSCTNILGDQITAIFVKASGQDLSTIGPEGHPGLDLQYLRRLQALQNMSDEGMLREIRTHLLDFRSPTPSIETLVHAFLPQKFIDHTHADAILALTNQTKGETVVREALGDEIIVLDYVKPGFELAKTSLEGLQAHPGRRAMVWMRHGLVTWGETARESYETMIELVSRAESYLAEKASSPVRVAMGTSLESAQERWGTLAPMLRGFLAEPTGDEDRPYLRKILTPLISRDVLDFVDSDHAKEVALTPPLTSDHLIRTKTFPLWIEAPSYHDTSRLREQIKLAVANYRASYQAYLNRHSSEMDSALTHFDPAPCVVLIPGMGAACSGQDIFAANICRDITAQTIQVKTKIRAMGAYQGLSEGDLFAMEYRGLQHAKLAPSRQIFRGYVALVTGAAGAIGSGISRVLLEHGCHVAATDLPGERLEKLVEELRAGFPGRAIGVPIDVADPHSVHRGFAEIISTWGGVDLVVPNAGVALVSPLKKMALEVFRRLQRVNVEGTLNILSETARHFEIQGTGGDVVLISSKNVFSPGAQFGAYSATKAAAHQLARIASLEMSTLGVRVNMVAPDAVFAEGKRKSGLWSEVGPARMRARGLDEQSLEEYYRKRSLLTAKVTATHVANAVVFFASRRTPTTGATLPVDGGLPDATPR